MSAAETYGTDRPYFTDAEVDEMCDGLVQDAAKIRHLRRLGLRVDRKPNGKPLAWRPAVQTPAAQNEPPQGMNVVGLEAWAAGRKERSSGKSTQGRRPDGPGRHTPGLPPR